jgi:hypothetical protein
MKIRPVSIQYHIIVFLFLFVLYLPVLYLTYKYHNPFIAFTDYFSYYSIYKNLDIGNVESPFNMRLLSSFITHLFYKLGLYYHTKITFEYLGYDQRVFFCAVFTNWISIVLSSYMIMLHLIKKENLNLSYALLISIIFLFSAGNLIYCMNGNTDGFTIIWIVILYFFYKRNSYFVLLLYLFTIFQREVALLFFFFLSVYDSFNEQGKRFYVISSLFAFLGIVIYYFLRKTYFYTPYFSHQLDLMSGLKSLINLNINLKEIIMQVFLPQTFYYLAILLLLHGYLKIKDKKYRNDLIFILFITFMFFLFGIMTLSNNNIGRFYHMISPVVLMRFLVPGLKEFLSYNKFL